MLWECTLGPEYQVVSWLSLIKQFFEGYEPSCDLQCGFLWVPWQCRTEVALPVFELGMSDHISPLTYGSESVAFTARQDDVLYSIYRVRAAYLFLLRGDKADGK